MKNVCGAVPRYSGIWYNSCAKERKDMPAVMEQVSKMSTAEKLRLMEYILKSISATVESSDAVSAPSQTKRNKPRISDFIGYGRRFHPEYRSTEDVMRELREGEEE